MIARQHGIHQPSFFPVQHKELYNPTGPHFQSDADTITRIPADVARLPATATAIAIALIYWARKFQMIPRESIAVSDLIQYLIDFLIHLPIHRSNSINDLLDPCHILLNPPDLVVDV